MSRSIPTFGSFKPDVAAVSKAKRHTVNKHDKGLKSQRYPSYHTSGVPSCHLSSSITSHAVEDASTIYVIDRKGDSSNVKYGSNDRSKVPAYRETTERKLVGRSRQPQSYHQANVLSHLTSNQKTMLKLDGQHVEPQNPWVELGIDADYLPLNPTRKRKRGSDALFGMSNVADSGSGSDISSGDSDVAASIPDAANSLDLKLRRSHDLLVNRTRTNPEEPQAWLDLIDFQDTWVRYGFATNSGFTSVANLRVIAQAKLDIVMEALKTSNAPSFDDDHKSRLLLTMMHNGAKLWDEDLTKSTWHATAQNYKECLPFWLEYLYFVFNSGGLDQSRKAFRQFLDLCDAKTTVARDDNAYALWGTLRITCFLRDTGHHELSLAIWQALFMLSLFQPEMSSFCSSSIDVDPARVADPLNDLILYWESEVVRIGEFGYLEAITNSNDASSPSITTSNWICSERARMQSRRLPGRTSDDDEEDPYHVIMFSDIEPYIHVVDNKTHSELLLDSFLCFCGLPSLPVTKTFHKNPRWRQDSTLLTSALSKSVMEAHTTPITSHGLCAQISCDMLFPEHIARFGLQQDALSLSHDAMFPADPEFVGNLLETLANRSAQSFDSDALAQLYLAFEFLRSPVVARRKTRTLLKRRTSSLPLYSCLGIQTSLSDMKAADSVFSAAIAMVGGTGRLKDDRYALLRTWTWEAVWAGEYSAALAHLANIDASERFDHSMPNLNGESCFADSIYAGECLLLLNYLTGDNYANIGAAVATFEGVKEIFKQGNIGHLELFHQAFAQLINFHVSQKRGPFAPKTLRAILGNSANLFPCNTIFPSVFLKIRSGVDDHIHSITTDTMLLSINQGSKLSRDDEDYDHVPVWRWFCLISARIARIHDIGSTAHAVRSLFEKAVSSTDGQRCADLWTWYFKFEIEREEWKLAKRLWYRGYQQMPLSKAWVMLGFRYLVLEGKHARYGFGKDETKAIYETMQNRELRLCISIL